MFDVKVRNRKLLQLSLTENWSGKPFFLQELLKTYEILDFTAASDSGVYI